MARKFSQSVCGWLTVGVFAATGVVAWSGRAEAQDPPEKPAASAEAARDTHPAASAPTPDAQPKAEPKHDTPAANPVSRKGEVQEVGVMVTAVSKIDVVKEAFEYDALVTIATTGALRACTKDAVQPLFPEGSLKKVDDAGEWEEGAKKFRQCKVTVEEQTTIDVSRYPFDSHALEITVGDDGDAVEGVEFKPLDEKEYTGIAPTVKAAGWEFGEISARQEQVTQAHAKAPLTRAVFEVHVARPAFQSFLKGFLGATFQLLIALVALVLAVKAAPNRIALVTGALIAVSTAHNQVSSQIGVTYLTTADKFFFVSYFLLLTNVAFTAAMVKAEDAKNDARGKFLYKLAWIVLPALTVILTALVLFGIV